jgi:hypothetical protein
LLAGQWLLFFAIITLFRLDWLYGSFLVLFVEIVAIFVSKNFTHRFLSTIIASFAFYYILTPFGLSLIIFPIYAFLIVVIFLKNKENLKSIGYAIAISLLFFNLNYFGLNFLNPKSFIDFMDASMDHFIVTPLVAKILIVFIFIYLLNIILKTYKIKSKAYYLIALFFALLSYYIHAITLVVIIVTVGFFKKERALFLIGIFMMILEIFSFYYSLQKSLLFKSELLTVSGLLFLLIWYYIKKTKEDYNE